MLGYLTTQKLVLKGQSQFKTITPAKNLIESAVKDIQLEAAEFDLALAELKKQVGEDGNWQSCNRIVQDTEIAAWENFPPRLGRVSLGLWEKQAETNHEKEKLPLLDQLRELVRRKPTKQHFRFALVNGFGGNLGDTLVGATAYRELVKVLLQELPSFSVDVLHGWHTNQACRDIIASEPNIDHIYARGLTLAQFGKYDAHFDVSALLTYAKFDTLPRIDWYLWWLGLDPELVDVQDKRNQYLVPRDTWFDLEQQLRAIKGKRVYFGHKASVPLRSIPIKQARRIALEIVNGFKEGETLIIDQEIGITHQNICNLTKEINSVQKFKALIGLVDEVITVDSFGLHLADAAAKPTVLLATVLPLEIFKYYPTVFGMLIPGAAELPMWLKVKTKDAEEWSSVEPAYEKAWQKIRGEDIANNLTAISKKIRSSPLPIESNVNLGFSNFRKHFGRIKKISDGVLTTQWITRRQSSFFNKVDDCIQRLGSSIVRPGGIIVYAGAGDLLAPVKLAEKIYPFGEFHLFEPRRLYSQTQTTNFILSGMTSLYVHNECPFASQTKEVEIAEIDPSSESNPFLPGNTYEQSVIECKPLDEINLLTCQLLVIQKPMPVIQVLNGAQNFLKQHKPFVLLTPFTHAESREACLVLREFGYESYAEDLGLDENGLQNIAVVAVPAEIATSVNGLMKVNLE